MLSTKQENFVVGNFLISVTNLFNLGPISWCAIKTLDVFKMPNISASAIVAHL